MNIHLQDKQEIALKQGEAYQKALDSMKKIAETFESKEVGDYIVSVAFEEAEGMYKLQPSGVLRWEIPEENENIHHEVAVQDKHDKRFIPGLKVTSTLSTEGGGEIGTKELPFLWHPFLYHYGANWNIFDAGKYTVKIHIDVPEFGRHDEDKGKRYQEPLSVSFGPIDLKPGRKEYGPE